MFVWFLMFPSTSSHQDSWENIIIIITITIIIIIIIIIVIIIISIIMIMLIMPWSAGVAAS